MSFVAAIGYVAFLAGPPALGFLGDRYGLRGAMVVVLVYLAVAAVCAPVLRDRYPSTSTSLRRRTSREWRQDRLR